MPRSHSVSAETTNADDNMIGPFRGAMVWGDTRMAINLQTFSPYRNRNLCHVANSTGTRRTGQATMKLLSLCVASAFVIGCSGSQSPTAPTPTPVVAPPPVVVTPPSNPLLTDPRFDVNFFRQFTTRPLKRWTQPPRIYLRTIDEGGRAVDARLLDQTAAAIINTTGAWTGGAFGVAGLERGTETRVGQAGWITVAWANLPNFCGTVTITVVNNGQVTINQIVLNNVEPICTCGPLTAKHELGHALGYNHTDGPLDLMSGAPLDGRTCDKDLSAREKFHAQVAYSLPAGSMEP